MKELVWVILLAPLMVLMMANLWVRCLVKKLDQMMELYFVCSVGGFD